MGLFKNLFKKKDAQSNNNSSIGFSSSGSTTDMWNSLGFKVNDYRSETEKNAEKSASQPLEAPLEQYANDIVAAFAGYDGNSTASDQATKAKVRPIGEKLNDNTKQLQVFHRAVFLAGNKGIRISTSSMERFWEGCGGWQV